MAFGIDTFRSHLDLINYTDFRTFNGGRLEQGVLVGGLPLFAGRNFLGRPSNPLLGDFIWGHAEATNASSEPSPEHPENLTLFVDRIAPIQAPQPARQQVVGDKGRLFGRIDADAICKRLKACIISGEFRRPQGGLVHVWLSVDPTVPFSVDYWSGWSDQVNNFHWSQFLPVHIGGFAVPVQPFRACILCEFSIGITQRLQPGPQVIEAMATAAINRGINTHCYALWADVPANPPLDWNRFSGVTMPLLWRFWHGFRNAAGNVVNDSFDVDAPNPIAGMQQAIDFMLEVQRWQPNIPDIKRYGFIEAPQSVAYAGISAAEIANVRTHPIPAMRDGEPFYDLPGGPVEVIGRYLKTPGHFPSMGRDEAVRLSNAQFELFTIWESFNDAAGGEPLNVRYFDPAFHAGTEDGRNAFTHCGNVLGQPSQTPVYFCVDYDAPDPTDARNTIDPAIAGIANLDDRVTAIKNRILHYFELVKAERDAYAQQNPGRFYLIGLYANAGVNRWCYEKGIVSFFWQSASTGGTNGRIRPGHPEAQGRPWYHANRWQFNREVNLRNAGWAIGGTEVVDGADPDADWGDGGTWTLTDPLSRALVRQELRESFLGKLFPVLVDLEP